MNILPNDDPVGGVFLKFRGFLKNSGYSTPTVKNYLADLNHFLSWGKNQPIFKPTALTRVNVQLYASYLKETFKTKPSIISRRISSLRKFLSWASKEGLVATEVLAASRQTKEAAVPFVDDITASYRATLKERKFSAPTVKNYVADVRAFLLWLKSRGKTLQNLKQSDIESYIFYLESSFREKPSIVARKTSSLRTFLSWAKEDGLVKIAPAKIDIRDFLADELKKISSQLPAITFHKKSFGHLCHNRPDWYHRYHRWQFSNALHYALLAVYLVSIGAGLLYFYVINPQMKQTKNEFKTELGNVLGAAEPPRILSFQGRLTDKGTAQPVITEKSLVFRIYTVRTGGVASWTSKTWTLTPDANGIFSVCLGGQDTSDECLIDGVIDTIIPSTLFSENPALYLGVTVVGEASEMSPRQRIASSSYALNSDALEGYHGSQSPGANQVPILDGSGYLMFAGASTIGTAAGGALTLDSDSGTLALGSGTTTISSAGALTLNSTTSSTVTLDSGTTGAINIGSNANAKTITIGNETGVTSLELDSGTGAISIGNAIAKNINIGNATGATLVNIDSGTGGVTIDSTGAGDIVVNSTDTLLLDSVGVLELNSSAGIISIGNDAVTQNINIGTGAAARTITIGNNTTITGIVLTKGASGEITLTGYNASCTALETDADGHLNCGTDDGAGSIAFSAVTAGTNTNALVIGTGGSLGTSGSGTITATDVVCTDCIALTSETSGNYVAYANTSALTGLTGGSSGSEGATLSLALDESQVLSGDPALSANTEVFGVNGLVFEGATANTFETFLAVTDPTADHTITFPNASGTVTVTATSPVSISALGDISVALATVSTTGIASFNDSYFGVSSGAVSIDDIYLLNNGDTSTGLLTLTGVPAGTGVDQGSLYINPASATSDYTLLGLAVNGTQKFRIDEDGDTEIKGHLALGYAALISADEILSVKETFSTGTPIGIRVNPTLNTDVSYAYGIQVDPIKNDATVTSGLFGIKVLPTLSSSGQVPSSLIGIQTSWSIGGSTVGSGGSGYGMLVAAPTASKLNVVGTAYGINISNQGNTNIGTASYGLYVADQTTAGGPSEYGIAIAGADTYALWVSSAVDTTDSANGITFGLSGDTNLYRSTTHTLATDDRLGLAWGITNPTTTTYGLTFGGTVAGIPDVNLYRSALDTLKTDDSFISAGLASVSGTNSVSNVPYKFLVDKDTTNLVVNPSFEVNKTDGWLPYGALVAGDLSQEAAPYAGSYSLRIYKTGAAINDGAQTTTMAVAASTKYVASVFVRAVSGSPTFKISLTGNNSGQTSSAVAYTALTSRWMRFFIYKASNTLDSTFTFEIYSSAAQDFYIYVDAVQLEVASCDGRTCGTTYADGSLGPEYSWRGTAHNSISDRTAGIKYLGGGANVPGLYAQTVYFEGGNGDLNLSGNFSATDTGMMNNYLAGNYNFDSTQLALADVSGDGKVSLDDQYMLNVIVAGLSTTKYELKRNIGNLYGAYSATQFRVNGTIYQVGAGTSTFEGSTTFGSTITLSSFTNCGALSTDSSGVLQCGGATGDTATFTDVSPGVVADSDATIMFNDATQPNITPNSTTQTVLVHASVRLDASGAADAIAAFRIVREDDVGSTTPACDGTDPQVGNTMIAGDLLLTTDFGQAQATVLDSPTSTAAVYYTVCTSTDTNMGVNVPTATSVTVTLIELGSDLAENYYTTDPSIVAGHIVAIDNSLPAGAKKTTGSYDDQMLGVVSTAPGKVLDDAIGRDFGRAIPIALIGRVPVKVNGENGPIAVGDLITSSSIPGVGMKATKAGYVIGRALTSFSGQGEGAVVAFVNTQYADPANLRTEGNLLDLTNSSSTPSAEATNSSSLKLDSENNIVATLSSGTRFVWTNSVGRVVAWVSDAGEAVFEKVTALVGDFRKLIFGELVAAKDSQNAGQASFEPDQAEVVIESDKVQGDSLIYITPTTKTDGLTLYIKEQKTGESFTIGLERSVGDKTNEATASATQTIRFNWLIVNQQ